MLSTRPQSKIRLQLVPLRRPLKIGSSFGKCCAKLHLLSRSPYPLPYQKIGSAGLVLTTTSKIHSVQHEWKWKWNMKHFDFRIDFSTESSKLINSKPKCWPREIRGPQIPPRPLCSSKDGHGPNLSAIKHVRS